MSNDNIVKLVAIVLIPVMVFFARSYVQDFLSANGGLVLDLTPMENIEKVSQQNSASVNMLKQFNANYIPSDVLAGVDPKNLYRYFSPNVKEEPMLEVIEETVVNVEKPKAKPRIKLPPRPNYNINFVFVGQDRSYITIGDSLLEIGDATPKGEVVKNIEANRVQLQGKWGLRWVPVNY